MLCGSHLVVNVVLIEEREGRGLRDVCYKSEESNSPGGR